MVDSVVVAPVTGLVEVLLLSCTCVSLCGGGAASCVPVEVSVRVVTAPVIGSVALVVVVLCWFTSLDTTGAACSVVVVVLWLVVCASCANAGMANAAAINAGRMSLRMVKLLWDERIAMRLQQHSARTSSAVGVKPGLNFQIAFIIDTAGDNEFVTQ